VRALPAEFAVGVRDVRVVARSVRLGINHRLHQFRSLRFADHPLDDTARLTFNDGEQHIHLQRLESGDELPCGGQAGIVRVYPVDHRLVVNREDAPDAAEVRTFEVEAHRFALMFLSGSRAASGRGVDALVVPKLITQTACTGMSGFVCCSDEELYGQFCIAAAYHCQHDLDTPQAR
jgi:hypothetical protein